MNLEHLILNNLAALAKRQLLGWLVAKLPFFALPIINPIFGFLIGKLVDVLFKKTYLGGMLIYIRIDLNSDLNAMEKILSDFRQLDGELTRQELEDWNEKIFQQGAELYNFNLR